MSAFPENMLLYPDGEPRVINADNRINGEINGVRYRVEVKGGVGICSFIDPHDGQQRRMFQPRFDALGVMVACIEVAEGKSFDSPMMGLRVRSDDRLTIDGY